MKKLGIFSIITAATLAMAGCTASYEFDESTPVESQTVQFSVNAKDSRGLEMTPGQLRNTGFGVVGYYTEQQLWSESNIAPNYMYNQSVVNKEGKWVYAPLRYWPSRDGDNISFFAYAPYEKTGEHRQGIALSENSELGAPSIVFTTKSSASEMVDFVAATAIDKSKTNENHWVDTINFRFNHELSRLSFTASNGTTDAYVNIKQARLTFGENNNVYQTATYHFANQNDTIGSWSYEEGQKFEGDYELRGILDVSQDVQVGQGETKYDVDGILLPVGTQQMPLFDGKYLFFIPAAGAAGLAENAVSVTFDFDIITLDENLAAGYSSTSHTETIAIPAGKLQQGKSYVIDFVMSGAAVEIGTEIQPACF